MKDERKSATYRTRGSVNEYAKTWKQSGGPCPKRLRLHLIKITNVGFAGTQINNDNMSLRRTRRLPDASIHYSKVKNLIRLCYDESYRRPAEE